MKHSLELLSVAADNYLRALVLAVVGAQYVYTAPAHAMEVLAVCETLGAGMGANPKKQEGPEGAAPPSDETQTKDGVGNAPLRLWVGERFLGTCFRWQRERDTIEDVVSQNCSSVLANRIGFVNRRPLMLCIRQLWTTLGRIVRDFGER